MHSINTFACLWKKRGKDMNKKFMVTALSSLLAVSLAGCSGGGSSSGGSEGGSSSGGSTPATAAPAASGDNILKFGTSGYEGVFNPILSDNVYDSYVSSLIFDGLLDVNSEGEYVPELAAEMPTLDEETKTVYTFTLRDGLTFSDGTPLTADDVAYTYNTIAEEDYAGPRTNVAGPMGAIAEVKVLDEKTVEFTMRDPSPANLQNFTYGILSAAAYEHDSFEALAAKNDTPVGCGQFTLKGWAPKRYVSLVPNPNYWNKDDIPSIDEFQMLEVSEDTLLGAMQNGQIDFCQPAAKLENVEGVEALPNAHLISYLANGYTFMCFNTTRPTLEQTEVRQALLYALDRRSFLMNEYGSLDLVSLGMAPISKTSWAYPGDDELNAYEYDIDKANEMLDAAGWDQRDSDGTRMKDGVRMDLHWLVYTEATWPGTLSSMAYDSWKQIGVNLIVDMMDFNTVAATTMDAAPGEKDFDIYTMGFSLSLDPDPTGGLFDADAYSTGGFNASGWRDERSQELLKAGLTEFDQDKRAEIYKEWAIIQNEQVPTAIVAYRSEIWAVNDRVHGLDDIGVYTDFTELLGKVTLD
ncbi:MAG: hypothetical protein E7190_08625 [Erysipelotrichaceae bacterium]|nr:hypothetical protein [Erysipelotrichaceae bacterium]